MTAPAIEAAAVGSPTKGPGATPTICVNTKNKAMPAIAAPPAMAATSTAMRVTVAKRAPRTGTKSNAIASDAVSVATSVIGRNFMNWPTMPGQNNNGAKAARVVAVDAVIGHAMRFAAAA